MSNKQQERIFTAPESAVNELISGLTQLTGEVSWAKINPFIIHIRNSFSLQVDPKQSDKQALKAVPATETATGVTATEAVTDTVTESPN